MSKIKVMIVDDHPVVREGLKQLLEISRDIEVVAGACSGLECLTLMESNFPDIVFMDIRMPGISGIETTRLITEKYPNVKVIVLTIYNDDQYVKEAILAGAKGYVLKNVTREELVRVIYHVMKNGAFLDPAVTATVLSEMKKEKPGNELPEKAILTQRELEVLGSLIAGLKDRDIGEALHISEHTVRTHIKSIYRKLKVSTRAQAAIKASQQGIIQEKIIDNL
jgi:two-component system, NarL family, response regulator DegU